MQIAPIEFLKAQWSWRWAFLTVAVLILASTAIYALMRPDLYRSETRILVEPKTVFDRELSAAESKESIEDQIQNLQQMLQSRTILQRIVEEFKLRSSDTSIPMEDDLKGLRNNLEVLKTFGSTFAIACYATYPQAAQAITKRLAEILVERGQTALQAKALENDEFLTEELFKAERKLDEIDVRIAELRKARAGERQDSPDQQALLREQARSQRHVDEIDGMKFNAAMAVSLTNNKSNDRFRILDEASLPERPEFPARHHILWMGIILALIAALPAVFMQRKAPSHSA